MTRSLHRLGLDTSPAPFSSYRQLAGRSVVLLKRMPLLYFRRLMIKSFYETVMERRSASFPLGEVRFDPPNQTNERTRTPLR